MLTLSEITRWTGITPFEVLIHTVAITVATVLLVFKWHAVLALTFWQVFAPLFVASALNCYFLFIIFIRAVVEEHQLKRPFMANAFNFLRAIMIVLFEILLCHKIEGDLEHGQVAVDSTYGVVFMPVWVLVGVMGFQACRML